MPDYNPEEMTDEFRWSVVRATRDRMLYITDTLMQNDRPDVNLTELKAYRKALRDITKQKMKADEWGMPEVSWPTKPQCVKNVECNFPPLLNPNFADDLIPSWSPPTR